MTRVFLLALLLSGAANLVCSIRLLRELAAAGVKVHFFEIRWQVHKHLPAYRKLTRERSGRVGLPYYGYIGSGIALVVSAALLLWSL
ncbi:MAG: hypothetical protein IH614_15190 [Desulfuromonadales bacterium]|nr:hypothetical protein [Desulfuromonadales bacterium]